MRRLLNRVSLRAQLAALVASVAVVAATDLPWAYVAVTAVGAAAFLRNSIGDRLDELQQATATIASGEFGHRINSPRRDELGVLSASIDDMAGRLQQLEAGRRRMLAAVSHELRTPLQVIRGNAFTLTRHETDDRRRAKLQAIDDEVGRLATLVDELLLAARLQAAPLELRSEPVGVDELVLAAGRRKYSGPARRPTP